MELKDVVGKCGRPLKKPAPGVEAGREKPAVWYDPAAAPVLQVKAAEFVPSTIYPTGCTLRFPRVQCTRPDRDHTSCTSLQDRVLEPFSLFGHPPFFIGFLPVKLFFAFPIKLPN
jgi:ATP-dependent DNA ligase